MTIRSGAAGGRAGAVWPMSEAACCHDSAAARSGLRHRGVPFAAIDVLWPQHFDWVRIGKTWGCDPTRTGDFPTAADPTGRSRPAAGPRMKPTAPPAYQARVVPALHQIQHAHGYLKREELERLAKESGLPECKVQAVASFFPPFHLSPPPQIIVRVCRDMACHMAGAADRLRALGRLAQGLAGGAGADRVRVEGASCLGRCDRAPAVCVSIHRRPAPGMAEPAGEPE